MTPRFKAGFVIYNEDGTPYATLKQDVFVGDPVTIGMFDWHGIRPRSGDLIPAQMAKVMKVW